MITTVYVFAVPFAAVTFTVTVFAPTLRSDPPLTETLAPESAADALTLTPVTALSTDAL